MTRTLATSALLLLTLASCGREAPSPLSLAQRYAALINQGKAAEAIEQTYDFKAITDRAFAEARPPITPAERDQIASMLKDMMTAPFVDPTMAKTMRSARFTGFDVQTGKEGLTIVSFTVHYDAPDGPRTSNALYFAPADDSFKAVDADTGRGATMVQMMASGYKMAEQTPILFVRDLHDAMLKRLKDAGGSLPPAPK